jgi:hypothetical protein
MPISDFIGACDAYCEASGFSRVWLSKRLFADTYRLDDLAAGKTDIGVKRLERASNELAALDAARTSEGAQGAAA